MDYMGFVNLTPFAAEQLLLADERGADVLTFVVKASYDIGQASYGSPLPIAVDQVPVQMEPVYHGDPEASSVKFDSEAVVTKVATDVVLIGHAHAPNGRATALDVWLRVGPVAMTVRVFGDRVWTRALGHWSMSAPAPFQMMPLAFERAFGGWDRSNRDPAKHEYEARNPVGVGFVSKHGRLQEGAPLPNLEDPAALIGSPSDHPAPVGFGFIGPHWQPRIRYAGTYDRTWKTERMPLLPHDFDPRFFNSAHPRLTAPEWFRGGEPVEVVNASARGTLQFQLPAVRPDAVVRMKDGATNRIEMNMDTVIINTDDDLLSLVWRGSMPVYKKIHDILWAKVQLLEPAS